MKKIFILGLAALTMTISCQKSNDSLETSSSHCVMRTITCTIAEPDPISKVSINATNGKTTWEVDDEILFHGKYTGEHNSNAYSVVVKLKSNDISADGKSFTATIPDFINGADQAKWAEYGSESNIIAAYPASAVAVHYGDNWYYQNKFNASNLPLMSGFNNEYDSNSFTFYNLTGLLSFIVDGEIDSYTLSGNGSEAVAYTDYASRIYKKTNGSIQTDWVYAGTPVTSVSGTVIPGEETRIFIPGGVTFSGGFTITFSDDGIPVKTLSTTKSVSIDRNSYRPMGNVTSYLADYVAPTTHDSAIDMTGATDLSASASANCYIVDGSDANNQDKVFTFKAYKGNSSTSVGSISSVEVLWETYNNATEVVKNSVIAAVDFDKQAANDYYEIVFKMPSTLHAGNALIAAKNAGGTILWSWHIWVPASEITSNDYGIYKAGKVMQDRNLGALSVAVASTTENIDVTSIGLVYQWGRKDPFLASDVIEEGKYRSWSTYSGTVSFTADSRVLSLDESIQNPTLYAKGISTNPNWLSPYDKELWGDSGSKAVYDPCPPGYRVPKQESNCYLFGDNSGTYDITNAPGWGYDMNHYWFKLGNPVTVFPCAGYRNGGDYSFKSTFRTIIWNAHSSSSKGDYDEAYYSAYNRRIEKDGSNIKVRNDSQSKFIAASVRCVAE